MVFNCLYCTQLKQVCSLTHSLLFLKCGLIQNKHWTKSKISYMSCIPKHDISSHFLHISGRGWGEMLYKQMKCIVLPYPIDFLHVRNPNFRPVKVKVEQIAHSWELYTVYNFSECVCKLFCILCPFPKSSQ